MLDNLDHNTHARGQGARVPLSGWGEWVVWGGYPGLQGSGKVLSKETAVPPESPQFKYYSTTATQRPIFAHYLMVLQVVETAAPAIDLCTASSHRPCTLSTTPARARPSPRGTIDRLRAHARCATSDDRRPDCTFAAPPNARLNRAVVGGRQ